MISASAGSYTENMAVYNPYFPPKTKIFSTLTTLTLGKYLHGLTRNTEYEVQSGFVFVD